MYFEDGILARFSRIHLDSVVSPSLPRFCVETSLTTSVNCLNNLIHQHQQVATLLLKTDSRATPCKKRRVGFRSVLLTCINI